MPDTVLVRCPCTPSNDGTDNPGSQDGGGIRGVVTLGFPQQALEEEIGALRGAFDLTVGTSAGALNASEIYSLWIDSKRSPQEVQGYGTGNLSPNTPFADDTFAIVESESKHGSGRQPP
ncbi:hypothetical protein V6Z93_009900 [Aspergillus fumigatus]